MLPSIDYCFSHYSKPHSKSQLRYRAVLFAKIRKSVLLIVKNPESAAALAAKMSELQQELIDRTESGTNYDDLAEEILRLRELQAQTAMDDNAKSEHKKRIRELLKFIEKQKNKVFVFDEALVRKLLEKVTVYDDYLEFRFKSGVTVSVEK